MKRFIILVVFAALVGFVWMGGHRWFTNPFPQTTILLATSPVSLWSWDRRRNTFTVLVFPSDYVVNGIDGYGRYSLEALWKLGFIDNKGGTILTRSIEQALAIQVPFYVGTQKDLLPEELDVTQYGKSVFSWISIRKFLLHRVKTNVPIRTYIAFSWALSRARLDAIKVIDLKEKSVTNPEELPDGTTRPVFDAERLDAVLKGAYEDEELASEGMTVAVYNTTDIPSLGTQAARMLSNLGILVIAVGNASPTTTDCSMRGTSVAMATKTARFIQALFSCKPLVQTQQERADITIHLGN